MQSLGNIMRIEENMLIEFFFHFSTMFLALSREIFVFRFTFNLLSANALSLSNLHVVVPPARVQGRSLVTFTIIPDQLCLS